MCKMASPMFLTNIDMLHILCNMNWYVYGQVSGETAHAYAKEIL